MTCPGSEHIARLAALAFRARHLPSGRRRILARLSDTELCAVSLVLERPDWLLPHVDAAAVAGREFPPAWIERARRTVLELEGSAG